MVRWSAWYLGLATAVFALAGLGVTQAQPGALGDNNPWVTLLPALRTAPAPGWLRPGMRLSYYSASARIESNTNALVPDDSCDPEKPGYQYKHEDDDECFQGTTTGKWYRRTSRGGPSSGLGFTEVNVVALDQTVAVLDTRSLNLWEGTGPAVSLGIWGSVELPGASGDWWLNPQVLRGAIGLSAPHLRVRQVQYPLGGRQYNAIWVNLTSRGRKAYVYDADTGVLLHASTANQTGPIQGPVIQGETREGATLLSQTSLLGTRMPGIPWALLPAPEWVRRVSFLRYDGSNTSIVTGGSFPFSTTFRRQAVGANWALYLQTTPQLDATGAAAAPAQGYRAFGSAQLGGLWIPPQGLAQLRQGQVLDDDPISKMRVFVGLIGRTPQGADTVTIAEENAAQLTEDVYDRTSGMLLHYSYTNKILRTKIQIQLTQRQ